jgi:hypothetical protein
VYVFEAQRALRSARATSAFRADNEPLDESDIFALLELLTDDDDELAPPDELPADDDELAPVDDNDAAEDIDATEASDWEPSAKRF